MKKHEAMYEYIKQYSPYLYFNALQDTDGAITLSTVYSDEVVQEYTTGDAEKEYIFAIAKMKQYDSTGLSDINVQTIEEVQEFMDWIDEQERKKNYPKFPPNCHIYKIENLQNMPNFAGTDEQSNVVEYMFQCRVLYTEYVR